MISWFTQKKWIWQGSPCSCRQFQKSSFLFWESEEEKNCWRQTGDTSPKQSVPHYSISLRGLLYITVDASRHIVINICHITTYDIINCVLVMWTIFVHVEIISYNMIHVCIHIYNVCTAHMARYMFWDGIVSTVPPHPTIPKEKHTIFEVPQPIVDTVLQFGLKLRLLGRPNGHEPQKKLEERTSKGLI